MVFWIPLVLTLSVMQAAPAAQNGIVQQWAGRIPRALQIQAPTKGYISNSQELAALWQAWPMRADMPVVDFEKFIVIVNTSRSSVFKVQAIQVDANGDMKTVLIASPDFRPDFAFVVTLTERKGARTLHGIPIE